MSSLHFFRSSSSSATLCLLSTVWHPVSPLLSRMRRVLLLLLVLSLWVVAVVCQGNCNFTPTPLVGGSYDPASQSIFNDSLAGNGQLCQTVCPALINITFDNVIRTITTVYNPTGLITSHAGPAGSSYGVLYLRATEVINGITVYLDPTNAAIKGIYFFTNFSRNYPIGDVTGSGKDMAGLGSSYVAAFTGATGSVLNMLGAITHPSLMD